MSQTATSSPRPALDLPEAAIILSRLYGLQGTLEELPGELDRNFLVTVAPERRFVLKIYGTAANAEVLDFQNAALAHIALHDASLPVPRVEKDRDGKAITQAQLADGSRRLVRLLSWLPGKTMGGSAPYEPADALAGRVPGAARSCARRFSACGHGSAPALGHDQCARA